MAKIIILLALGLSSCATVPRDQKAKPLVLSDSSYGVVVFGQKLTQVEETVNERPYVTQDEGNCKMVGFMKIPQVRFMVEDGIVTRADSVPGSKVVTDSGIKIGAPAEQVGPRATIKVSQHKYIDGAHYLTALSKDEKRAVIYEEVDGKVDRIRAGLLPSVGYVEQCH